MLRPLLPLPVPGPALHAQLYASPDGSLLAFTGPDVPGDRAPDRDSLWWIYLATQSPGQLQYAEPTLRHPR